MKKFTRATLLTPGGRVGTGVGVKLGAAVKVKVGVGDIVTISVGSAVKVAVGWIGISVGCKAGGVLAQAVRRKKVMRRRVFFKSDSLVKLDEIAKLYHGWDWRRFLDGHTSVCHGLKQKGKYPEPGNLINFLQ